MSALRAASREPLVHFALVGGLLFAVHARVQRPPPERVVIEKAYVEALRAEQKERTGEAPSEEETRGLVQRTIDEEVLYREALALGLDRGDVIVRRRLLQKMELILRAGVPEPSDEELTAYLNAHPERYGAAASVSFQHVFVSRDRHGDATLADAGRVLAALRAGADPEKEGDPFVAGAAFAGRSRADLAGVFGGAFADGVFAAPLDAWSGPIHSSYGAHLVRPTARGGGGAPKLATARARVREDLQNERREAATRDELERLRRKYAVEIQP